MRTGEELPSVRSAARFLGVAVVTVKTAYEELEKDGYVVTLPAKGSFVSANAVSSFGRALEEAERACDDFLNVCRRNGLNADEISDVFRKKLKESDKC